MHREADAKNGPVSRPSARGQLPRVGKAAMPTRADDHMVEHADAEERADVNESLGNGVVFGTRIGLGTRM